MRGITNPAEEYFKDGLWGWVTDQWKKLVATAGGALHIQFAGQEADVEVTQTAAADLTPGVCGWDGSAWRKLPLVWGYSGHYCQNIQVAASGAGDAIATGTTVPDDEVWVIERIVIRHDAGHNKELAAYAFDNGCAHLIIEELAATTLVWYHWTGRLTLPPGGNMYAHVIAPGNGKLIVASFWGYKMLIAE